MRSTTLKPILLAAGLGAALGALAVRHNFDFDVRARWPMLLGIAPFLVLSLYWAITAKDRAPDQRSEAPASATLHQVLVTASLLIIVLPVPGLTARVFPTNAVVGVCAFAIEVFGLALAIAARRELGRNWSANVRIAEGHALVRTGPYRYLRHPIYTGALCMYAGLAVITGALHALLGFALVCLAYWRKTTLEERILAQNFGPAFDDYRRRSWAVIPRIL